MPAERALGRRLTKVAVLAKREYLARVKTKGFWIGILVLPLLMALLFVGPALMISQARTSLDVVLVDGTGRLGEGVRERLSEAGDGSGPEAELDVSVVTPEPDVEAHRAELDRRLVAEEIDAWAWLDPARLDDDGEVEYHARSVSNTIAQRRIERAISAELREVRLTDAGYDPEEVGRLTRDVELRTLKVSAEGARAERGEAGFMLAYGIFFLLYIVLLIWGQQVLQGVLEEKSSRVVEVVISAARPFDLMLGKLLGIGGAAFTQFAVWIACLVGLTAPGLAASIAAMPEGLDLPRITVLQAVYITVFFVLGFFVYSSMYAAVGSAFNSLQEAQNLSSIPTFSIIAPMFFLFPVINDPGSTLAVVTSLVPLLSPILMPLRIAVEVPPAWQIWLAILLTAGFVWCMVWLCARIYRVGILMYGKKPTVRELVRWIRYA